MKTLLITNQKGGVGKTTTAINLAYIIAENGKKVLFIDADVQGNSTYVFEGKTTDQATIYDVITQNPEITVEETIQDTKWENLKIVASDPLLSQAVYKLQGDDSTELQFVMKDYVEKMEDMFDVIIIDTNPSLDSILKTCMIASDEIIIPVFADKFSAQGMTRLSSVIAGVKKRLNPSLHVAGILLGNCRMQTNLAKEMKERFKLIAEQMGTEVFESIISATVQVPDAIEQARMPVAAWKPYGTASLDFLKLFDELTRKGII